MEPTRIAQIAVALLATLFISGCGSGAGSVCDRAVECDFINESDFDECKSDIQDAVRDGDLERSDVRRCSRCAHDNDCGADILIDCASECDGVGSYVFGSQF